jgi:hypothetical protein
MKNDTNRPIGFYVRYLQRIAEQRERAGLPEPPDIQDDEAYWQQRKKWNEEQQK